MEHNGQVAEAVGRASLLGPHSRGHLPRCRGGTVTWPDPPFRHLMRITDHIGVLEYTEGIVPRHERGYCVADAARGLMIVCRDPSPRDELVTLARRYLHFLAHAH